jgi:hypothetical protein
MNKKSGTAGTAVEPLSPASAHEADVADPGAVEEVKAQQATTQTGKYGSVQTKPFKPPAQSGNGATQQQADDKETKKSWIEIELVDALDHPVPGQRYQITLPDNCVAEGALDENGKVRLDGIEPGTCKITFPGYDGRSWDKAAN